MKNANKILVSELPFKPYEGIVPKFLAEVVQSFPSDYPYFFIRVRDFDDTHYFDVNKEPVDMFYLICGDLYMSKDEKFTTIYCDVFIHSQREGQKNWRTDTIVPKGDYVWRQVDGYGMNKYGSTYYMKNYVDSSGNVFEAINIRIESRATDNMREDVLRNKKASSVGKKIFELRRRIKDKEEYEQRVSESKNVRELEWEELAKKVAKMLGHEKYYNSTQVGKTDMLGDVKLESTYDIVYTFFDENYVTKVSAKPHIDKMFWEGIKSKNEFSDTYAIRVSCQDALMTFVKVGNKAVLTKILFRDMVLSEVVQEVLLGKFIQ